MTKLNPIVADVGHRPYLFTQRDFMLLAKNGRFDALAKAELIEGVIFAVNAQFSRHVRCQTLLFRALAAACDASDVGISAWIDGSVSINDNSMPQPDIFVAAELPEEGPVPAGNVLLVVEIADTSLDIDLKNKAAAYSSAAIPEYWIADVNGRVIHQLWGPAGEAYAQRREVAFGEAVVAVSLDGLAVDTKALLD